MSDLFGNPEDLFSHDEAHMSLINLLLPIDENFKAADFNFSLPSRKVRSLSLMFAKSDQCRSCLQSQISVAHVCKVRSVSLMFAKSDQCRSCLPTGEIYTTSLSKILKLYVVSVAEQARLCLTHLKALKTDFLMTRLLLLRDLFISTEPMNQLKQ